MCSHREEYPGRMADEQTLLEAMGLAEELLERVTEPAQDWPAIERMARALAEIASVAAERDPGAGGHDPGTA